MSEMEDLYHAFADFIHNVDIMDGDHDIATRDRPYHGQPHTFQGEYGKTVVSGLTIRDICDCFAKGLLEASGQPELQDAAEKNIWTYDDLYHIDGCNYNPIAAIQNAVYEMGCMMQNQEELKDKSQE
ncbi:MAG: hypothetical protein WC346_09720 [Methanogenium sp.]|jgi:hypothetical protein